MSATRNQASHASDSANGGSPSGASDDSPPHISEEQLKSYFVAPGAASDFVAPGAASDSSDDLCGPHQDCCGGSVLKGSYTSCVKRLGKGGYQHPRAQVCLALHKYFQCATCKNVVHSGCWVRTAKGSFMLPSALTAFHCFACASKPPVVAVPVITVMSTNDSKQNQEPVVADTSTTSSNYTERTSFMSQQDMRKHFKARNWRCLNSTASRIYYCCRSKKCDVKFTAIKETACVGSDGMCKTFGT